MSKWKASKFKSSYLWVFVAIVCGLLISLIITNSIKKYNDLVPVFVAGEDLKVDMPISKDLLIAEQRPRHLVPETAIKSLQDAEGLYANTTILKGQVIEKRAISNSKTLRELVRKYGLDYGTLTIPLEQSDIPVDQIHVGDTINLIGTFTKGSGNDVKSNYVAENVPVIDVVNDTKAGVGKITVAITRPDALNVTRDLAMGKIRIMLDPRAFSRDTPKYNVSTTEASTHLPSINKK